MTLLTCSTIARPSDDTIISIQDLHHKANDLLDQHVGYVWIQAQCQRLTRAQSGHCYMELTDGHAQISAVWFKGHHHDAQALLQVGQAFLFYGRLQIYSTAGRYQFIIEQCLPQGQGQWMALLAKRKADVIAMGWTDDHRKRSLPYDPQRIGVVTSAKGAALADVIMTLTQRRFQGQVFLYPSLVQGQEASRNLAAMLKLACEHNQVDVLLLCRGGGSIEDLWPFNEMPVIEAIVQASIPVITGIGHQPDESLSDLVADKAAHTPTAAASILVPDGRLWPKAILALQHRLQLSMQSHIHMMLKSLLISKDKVNHIMMHRIDKHLISLEKTNREVSMFMMRHLQDTYAKLQYLQSRLHPRCLLQRCAHQQAQLDRRRSDLDRLMQWRCQLYQHHLQGALLRAKACNPQHILGLGYAAVFDQANRRLRTKADSMHGKLAYIAFIDGKLYPQDMTE